MAALDAGTGKKTRRGLFVFLERGHGVVGTG
jgi:hypothetical protein